MVIQPMSVSCVQIHFVTIVVVLVMKSMNANYWSFTGPKSTKCIILNICIAKIFNLRYQRSPLCL